MVGGEGRGRKGGMRMGVGGGGGWKGKVITVKIECMEKETKNIMLLQVMTTIIINLMN